MTSGNDVAGLNKRDVDVEIQKRPRKEPSSFFKRLGGATLSRFSKLLLQVANNIL
jgi:hypothetical protein